MRKLFWIAAAVLTALATHTAFILLVPGFTLKLAMARASAAAGENRFFIMSGADQIRLFPTYPGASVIGACAFNVAKGPIELAANLPDGFWTLTIYSSTGEVIYAVNDSQTGTGSFTVNLVRAPGLLEMLSSSAADDPDSFNGYKVKTVDPRGLAVLWQPVPEPALRSRITRSIAATICRSAPKQTS